MPSYLRVEVGPYFLLVPTAEVFEVLAFAPAPGEDGYLVWREQILCAVSMRHQLGLPKESAGVLIVHGDAGHGLRGLVVDKVLGLAELEDGDFRPLPASGGPLGRQFDGVWRDTGGNRQALRLRSSNQQGRIACAAQPLPH